MHAFHGDPAIKAKYMARVAAHEAADEVVQGLGFFEGRGCAIGCTLDAYDHKRYPIELGLPNWFARLEDAIHEGLPIAEARTWPRRCLEAIPVGAVVDDRMRHALSEKRLERLLTLRSVFGDEPVALVLRDTIAWLRRGAPESEREAIRMGARASTARASAAWAWAAAFAAEAAAEAASARHVHWQWEAATLLELLAKAPIENEAQS